MGRDECALQLNLYPGQQGLLTGGAGNCRQGQGIQEIMDFLQ